MIETRVCTCKQCTMLSIKIVEIAEGKSIAVEMCKHCNCGTMANFTQPALAASRAIAPTEIINRLVFLPEPGRIDCASIPGKLLLIGDAYVLAMRSFIIQASFCLN